MMYGYCSGLTIVFLLFTVDMNPFLRLFVLTAIAIIAITMLSSGLYVERLDSMTMALYGMVMGYGSSLEMFNLTMAILISSVMLSWICRKYWMNWGNTTSWSTLTQEQLYGMSGVFIRFFVLMTLETMPSDPSKILCLVLSMRLPRQTTKESDKDTWHAIQLFPWVSVDQLVVLPQFIQYFLQIQDNMTEEIRIAMVRLNISRLEP